MKPNKSNFVTHLVDALIAPSAESERLAALSLSNVPAYRAEATRLLEHLIHMNPDPILIETLVTLYVSARQFDRAIRICERFMSVPGTANLSTLLIAWIENVRHGLDSAVPLYRRLVGRSDLPNAWRVGTAGVLTTDEIGAILLKEKPQHQVVWLIEPDRSADLTAYVCCDEKYFRVLFDDYATNVHSTIKARIHVHIVNPSPETLRDASMHFPRMGIHSHMKTLPLATYRPTPRMFASLLPEIWHPA